MSDDTRDDDPYDLARFLEAQAGTFPVALAELRSGTKRTHWMWFVFPQFDGLGSSYTAHRYAIRSLAEAKAYLAHPVLGPRLAECARAAAAHRGRTLRAIFGTPDDMKFRSSMTLFELAAGPEAPFAAALDALCGGQRDLRTLELVRRAGSAG